MGGGKFLIMLLMGGQAPMGEPFLRGGGDPLGHHELYMRFFVVVYVLTCNNTILTVWLFCTKKYKPKVDNDRRLVLRIQNSQTVRIGFINWQYFLFFKLYFC